MAINSELTFGSYMPLRSCKKVNGRWWSSSSHHLFGEYTCCIFPQNEVSEKQVIDKALSDSCAIRFYVENILRCIKDWAQYSRNQTLKNRKGGSGKLAGVEVYTAALDMQVDYRLAFDKDFDVCLLELLTTRKLSAFASF